LVRIFRMRESSMTSGCRGTIVASDAADWVPGTDRSLVIIGASLAGTAAAIAARENGFLGRLVLIGDEPHAPYDRPPLSKDVLKAAGAENTIGLSCVGPLTNSGAEFELGCAVIAIDRNKREVELTGGRRIPYDRLLLTTGSRVRPLELLPPGSPGVSYLRDVDDAIALQQVLAERRKLAIIGAGIIGLEVAATARTVGCDVTVIEAGKRVMGRAASPTISTYFEQRHREAGVDFRFNLTVSKVERTAQQSFQLSLSNGEMVLAEHVLVGIGVMPNLELAASCGLSVEPNGIVVDQRGATDDPAIFAAGEVAVHYNDLFARHDRQETWAHAVAHGEHVGRAIVSGVQAYRHIPSYWTDQYDINMQVVGTPTGIDVVRRSPKDDKFLVFHLLNDAVAGVSAVNSVRELRLARKLIGSVGTVNAAILADPSTDIAKIVQDQTKVRADAIHHVRS
jgi:3-phenylpropionate/trans-cinnamate dioxygenase ferredoxin reductase component